MLHIYLTVFTNIDSIHLHITLLLTKNLDDTFYIHGPTYIFPDQYFSSLTTDIRLKASENNLKFQFNDINIFVCFGGMGHTQ